MKHKTKIIAILLLVAMLLSCLAACAPSVEDIPTHEGETPNDESPKPPASTDSETNEDMTTDSEPQPEDGESGVLGDPTPPEVEPDPEKPQNPDKILLFKSMEQYSGGNLGCTELTVLAAYNRGMEWDTKSYRDHTNKIFYLYLPCRADLSAVTFSVTHRDGSQSGPYTANFADDEVTGNERVMGNTSNYEIRVMQSDLPSVMLQIDETYGTLDAMHADTKHKTYAYGSMVVSVTDEMAAEKGWATRYASRDEDATLPASMKMRGRGNATWGYPKKPYQFVTENAIPLLGMERASKYVLVANYYDASGMRNQLALEMGHLIGLAYTSDYRQVDLFLNGTYLGMYMLAEKVEVGEGRVEIDAQDDLFMEMDNFALTEEFGFLTPLTSNWRRGIRLHNPETQESLDRTKAHIAAVEDALKNGNDAAIERYFDLESWAKMYLVHMYTMNSDAFYGSMYFYLDHKDGKLYACSPWDFDYSFGISYSSSAFYLDPNQFDVDRAQWIPYLLKHENFLRAVLDVTYKQGGRALFETTVPALVERYTEENRLSAEMNETAAPVKYTPSTVTDYDTAVAFLKENYAKRVAFMKKKLDGFAATISYAIPS